MARLLANHGIEGDFVVDVTEGVITKAHKPETRADIQSAQKGEFPKNDRDLVQHLNDIRSGLTYHALDRYDEDEGGDKPQEATA